MKAKLLVPSSAYMCPWLGELLCITSNVKYHITIFSPALVSIGFTILAAATTSYCVCWSKWPLEMISDYGRYFVIIFSVRPVHVEKDPSLIACIRVSFVGNHII